ncbi:DUF3955 domain-containing protein [Staphylococcus sp. GSSP0090]|nr:DUF3955 domain-containing protein [Staphylococcus sp. GSSP0090]
MKKLNISGTVLLILGVLAIVIKGFTPEYLDSNNILHEYFFLVPLGFSFIFVALCIFLSSMVIFCIKKLQN